MIIDSLWQRLDVLTPEPQCRTFKDDYDLIQWDDVRPQPQAQALQAVTQIQIDARIEERRPFDVQDFVEILINKNIINPADVPGKARKP